MHKSSKPIDFWAAVAMGVGAMVGAGIFALLGEASAENDFKEKNNTTHTRIGSLEPKVHERTHLFV